MDITFGLFLWLDSFQWVVLLTSLAGASICGYLFFTNKLHRLKMGLLLAYNIYVILRYMLLIYFRQDSPILSSAEANTLNLLGQMILTYISGVIIYLALDARHQVKLLTKKGEK